MLGFRATYGIAIFSFEYRKAVSVENNSAAFQHMLLLFSHIPLFVNLMFVLFLHFKHKIFFFSHLMLLSVKCHLTSALPPAFIQLYLNDTYMGTFSTTCWIYNMQSSIQCILRDDETH
jgi:hypothetical protein